MEMKLCNIYSQMPNNCSSRQIAVVSNFCANPTDRRRWRAVTFLIQPLANHLFTFFWVETDRALFTPLNSELKSIMKINSCDNFKGEVGMLWNSNPASLHLFVKVGVNMGCLHKSFSLNTRIYSFIFFLIYIFLLHNCTIDKCNKFILHLIDVSCLHDEIFCLMKHEMVEICDGDFEAIWESY